MSDHRHPRPGSPLGLANPFGGTGVLAFACLRWMADATSLLGS